MELQGFHVSAGMCCVDTLASSEPLFVAAYL